MRNVEVAQILREIALLLEMDDVQFKPRAYEKAALSLEALEEEVEAISRRGGVKALTEIPRVGQSIAESIQELIQTGTLKYYEELKAKVPVNLASLSGIEGVGPKTIKRLWQNLKIKNIDDLEKAARANQIRALPGFKAKTEQNILKAIEFARRHRGRYILGFALPLIRDIAARLHTLSDVETVVVAGSVRRMKATIGDADFLVVSENPIQVMDFFVSIPEVIDVLSKGETKSSVKLRTRMNVDLRVLPRASFGSALQYFTGSKDHNIALRRLAQERGLKLSEYGLFKGDEQIAGRTEAEVYRKLGLQWIPPELRENTGEIEVAMKNRLPHLVGYNDLKGDLQVHSNWTDGANSIREMAEAAGSMGLEYIVISDHSKSLSVAGGLDEKMLRKQGEEIDALNEEITGITILKGVELNILKDGSVDLSNKVLEELDVVAAGIHSHFHLSSSEMTDRVVKAVENPHVNLLVHPTTRQIQKREPVQLDIEKVIEAAKANGTILDIDSYPDRLDLNDEYIKKVVGLGANLGISSDSHNKLHLRFLELGVAQARRGWATAENIVNTRNLEEFLQIVQS